MKRFVALLVELFVLDGRAEVQRERRQEFAECRLPDILAF